MTKAQKAYLVCMERGHSASWLVIDTLPPYDTCKHCGTTYRYERRLEEARTPFGWMNDIQKDPNSEAYRIVVRRERSEAQPAKGGTE